MLRRILLSAGLATALHARTVEYAKAHGVRGLTADVLTSNPAMLRVFARGEQETRVTTSGGVHDVRLRFAVGGASLR